MSLHPLFRPAGARFVFTTTALAAFLALAGCAGQTPTGAPVVNPGTQYALNYIPDFARKPYEPFRREDAVAIALREWRLFGQPVDDDPPGTRPEPPPDLKPERMPGLWERVGEYWWSGLNPDSNARYWTGKHDAFGVQFPASDDGEYAWSAAFISYVMRIAGAGDRFPYSEAHATYINAAAATAKGESRGWIITAQRPDSYAPQPGDLICTGRDSTKQLTFDSLPRGGFESHCDIVVQVSPGQLSVIGGNVDDAVTMKHVPVTSSGMLADRSGTVLDTRYPWFVVIRVLYDTD
jgi:hypothetical protein